jgi:hypothetical protein
MPIVLRAKHKPKIHAVLQDDAYQQHERDQLNSRISRTELEHVPIENIRPNPRNAKKHSKKQIALIVENIKVYGFTQPVIIDEHDQLIAGHARFQAAAKAGMSHLPSIRLANLSEAAKRALAIADNRLAELGEWDVGLLQEELNFLFDSETDLSFDPCFTGFEVPKLDQMFEVEPRRADPADRVEPPDANLVPISTKGDLWICGDHKLLCGSALEMDDYSILMGDERAELVFSEVPRDIPNVSHPDVDELGTDIGDRSTEVRDAFCANILQGCLPGAAVFLGVDWRGLPELQAAADAAFGAPENLIVWVKFNACVEGRYRSQHEIILLYVASGARLVGPGAGGGKRSDVWKYPAPGRLKAKAEQRTGKPVALVADALLDCSQVGGIVLDPLGASGTTMIAAEKTGRRARLIEVDPSYCDLILERWQKFSNKTAYLAETGETFEQVVGRRQPFITGARP